MDFVQYYTIGFFFGLYVYHSLLIYAYRNEEKNNPDPKVAELLYLKQQRSVLTVAVNLIVFIPLIGRIFNVW